MRGSLVIERRYVLVDCSVGPVMVLAHGVTLSYPVSDTGVAARMIDPAWLAGTSFERRCGAFQPPSRS
jgi:hypothetical protein